jgi:hypothetical protein
MRASIPAILANIAALVAASPGCRYSSDECARNLVVPPPKTVEVQGNVACQLAQLGTAWGLPGPCAAPVQYNPGAAGATETCAKLCGPGSYNMCGLPDNYVEAYSAAQASAVSAACEAGAPDDGSAVTVPCPSVAGTVNVMCFEQGACTGRRTEGIDDPRPLRELAAGDHFAASSYLEAASVLAFERLARELAAHGAPANLVRDAWRARRDEVRHARRTRALARRFGVEAMWPEPRQLPVRTLFEMAQENGREGCVRETYGAVAGLLGAARASDAEVRTAMKSIARDECQHARLSWRVAAWAMTRLGPTEQEAVSRAMRVAAQELLAGGDGRVTPECRALTGMPSQTERRRIGELLGKALFRAGRVCARIVDQSVASYT